jgi:hypothetical protein
VLDTQPRICEPSFAVASFGSFSWTWIFEQLKYSEKGISVIVASIREISYRFLLMFTKSCIIGVLSVLFFTLAGAWASPVEGVVKDAQGKPLPGAEIRIQTQDGKLVGRTSTDAHGHYLFANLPNGIYKVDCLVNSVLKASIKNVSAKGTKPAQLSFALTGKTMAKGGKHFVWVPANTGTNIGGRWVEVDEAGNTNSGDRVQHIDGAALQRAGGTGGGLSGIGAPNGGGSN